MISVSLLKLPHGQGLPLPTYATNQSAGLDLMAAIGDSFRLKPLDRKCIPTGLSIVLPEGYEAQVRPRSGLALKHGLTVLNAPGTIDSDYRGEIQVLLINLGNEDFLIERGMRIAQLVLSPVSRLCWKEINHHENDTTLNRLGGFGSTGLRQNA
jgi:dUTP pyrophosphatase